MDKVIINGREFTVEVSEDKETYPDQGAMYTLKGKRGAVYKTIRNFHDKSVMFLVSGMKVLDRVWLSDKDGVLKQVR